MNIKFKAMQTPEHCPGTSSESAGKVSACQGCPNQRICSSGDAASVDPGIALVKARMSTVKYKILIVSGKGGVGKSTFTALLSRLFASMDENKAVGVLDIDICGPSIPRLMGVMGEQVHQSGSGWSPVFVEDNLSVMSIGFLLPNASDAIIWRGPRKNGMIRQFLSDVDWSEELEYLLIDTPPGTSDEHLSVTQYLKELDDVYAIVLTTPQQVSLLDVRKEISFLKQVKVPIIGVVENMSSFVCPRCNVTNEIFRKDTGGAEKMCEELNIRYLGTLPMDPAITKCSDQGLNPLQVCQTSATIGKLQEIVKDITTIVNEETTRKLQNS